MSSRLVLPVLTISIAMLLVTDRRDYTEGVPLRSDPAKMAVVAPTIGARSLNPDSALPREQCLAIGLGKAAAVQCGDLIVSHALPMIRTMNVSRVPTLIYNSAQAQPTPSVAIKVTIPSGSTLPDTVEATIKIGAEVRGRQRWPASLEAPTPVSALRSLARRELEPEHL